MLQFSEQMKLIQESHAVEIKQVCFSIAALQMIVILG
jgi:hypothetical protein